MCVPYSTFTSHFLRIIGASGCYLSSSRLLPTTVTIDIILSDQRHRHFDIGVVYLLTCEGLLAELHTIYSYSVWRLRRGGCKETMGLKRENGIWRTINSNNDEAFPISLLGLNVAPQALGFIEKKAS